MTDSLSELKQLLQEQEESLGVDDPKVANTLTTLGDLLCTASKFSDAEPLYWRVLEIRHKTAGQRSLEVASALIDLSNLYERQESWADAERMLRWCCDLRRELLGPRNPDYITTISRLGRVLDVQGKHEDISLEVPNQEGTTVPGIERYPWAAHCATARDLLKRGSMEEAARYLSCLADTAACFGSDTVHHARILNLQARALFRLNQNADAKTACEQALAIFERVFGTNHLETMECLVNMANIHVAQHEFSEARFLYQWAHTIAITLEGEESDKARKLDQKISSLPTAKVQEEEKLDGSFLHDLESAVLFSTAEYMKPDLSKLNLYGDGDEFLPREPSRMVISQGHRIKPEPPHSVPETKIESNESDRADQFFAQLHALSNLERERSKSNSGGSESAESCQQPDDVESANPSDSQSQNAKFHTGQKPKPVSEFGKAFGLETPTPEPEVSRSGGPHYIEEFDTSVACFLWEKYVVAGHRAMAQRDYVEAERMYAVAAEKANVFNDDRFWKTLCHLGMAHQKQKRYVRAESVFTQAQTLCEKRLGPEHAENIQYWTNLAELYVEQDNGPMAQQCYRRLVQLMTRAGKPDNEVHEIKLKLPEFQEQPSH